LVRLRSVFPARIRQFVRTEAGPLRMRPSVVLAEWSGTLDGIPGARANVLHSKRWSV